MVNKLSMLSRYNFDYQRAGFYMNDDPKCVASYGLEPLGKYLVFFNGKDTPPLHVDLTDEGTADLAFLQYTLNS